MHRSVSILNITNSTHKLQARVKITHRSERLTICSCPCQDIGAIDGIHMSATLPRYDSCIQAEKALH
jgi:hypothetical protein